MKIKEKPKVDRPRERYIRRGAKALSKSDLLAIVIGSGVKGRNVQQLAEQIIKKYNDNFLDITLEELISNQGIGEAKALQILAAINLVQRFIVENRNDIIIKSYQDVLSITYDLLGKKKEYVVCLYLNPENKIIKKETISIGIIDKSLIHPREIFHPAIEYGAARIIVVHNHPQGESFPSDNDLEIAEKLSQAGKIMGIALQDFIILGKNGAYSLYDDLSDGEDTDMYVASGEQQTLFDLFEISKPEYKINKRRHKWRPDRVKSNGEEFQIQNRRYLGNKYKLLGFIEDIVEDKCDGFSTFCDIFAGTGVVGEWINREDIKIISNDILYSNYVCLQTFLGDLDINRKEIIEKIKYLNSLKGRDNYFSINFGGNYFTLENAQKIGMIRDEIELIAESEEDKCILICSLIYAVDRIANTVGHYDAYRKKLESSKPVHLKMPFIQDKNNKLNEIYSKDANELINEIECDVLYIDPPYNSRQYSDAYHLLENLARWEKPAVYGKARKMDRTPLKSLYCMKSATKVFEDLIKKARCKHILLSYNNTGERKDGRSNARITDSEIMRILGKKGVVEIFEREYKAFSAGKSKDEINSERIFYCRTRRI